MIIIVASHGIACSTLLIGDFFGMTSDFKQAFREEIEEFDLDHPTEHFKQYGWVVASLSDAMDNYDYIYNELTELGFKPTEMVYNTKNGTAVQLLLCPATKVLQELDL